METCSACPQRLIWALTPTGARAPIDYAPSPEGNVLLLQPDGFGAVLAVTFTKDGLERARERGLPLRTSHFTTCVHADKFKKR